MIYYIGMFVAILLVMVSCLLFVANLYEGTAFGAAWAVVAVFSFVLAIVRMKQNHETIL